MRVAVVMPVKNRQKVAMHAIESVCGQTYKDIELVIVDDGSDIPFRYDPIGNNNLSISILRSEVSIGAAASRNMGVNACSSELLAFIDSDDKWSADKIEKQVRAYDHIKDQGCIVYTNVLVLDEFGHNVERKVINYSGEVSYEIRNGWYGPLTSSIMVGRESYCAVNGFDEKMESMQEVDLYYRLREKVRFCHINEPLTIWNTSRDSITSNRTKYIEGRLRFLRKHGATMTRTYKAKLYRSIASAARAENRPASMYYSILSAYYKPFNRHTYGVLLAGIVKK